MAYNINLSVTSRVSQQSDLSYYALQIEGRNINKIITKHNKDKLNYEQNFGLTM